MLDDVKEHSQGVYRDIKAIAIEIRSTDLDIEVREYTSHMSDRRDGER